MPTTTNNPLSDTQASQFFAAPEPTLQRQYEALRAYFLDNRSAADVAGRFGYSTAALRSLCHQFRHDPAVRAGFFQTPRSCISLICRLITFCRYSACFMGSRLR